MDLTLLLKSLIMGIVEGLTEFLPVSSLGHVIIIGDLLHFPADIAATFEIFVQTGALIALILYFARDLITLFVQARTQPDARRLLLAVAVAFLPAAIIGFLFGDLIKQFLFNPISVAAALLIGGVLMLLAEQIVQNRPAQVRALANVDLKRALAVGLSQVLALYPGMSRSAPTIAGGLLASLDRPTALRFSFYLAIPTLLAASAFDLVRSLGTITLGSMPSFAIGAVTSFLVALVVIHFFLSYVSSHTLRPFAWYRIVVGLGMLVVYTHFFAA
jgi:undecaprenyl-diphosphatase